jgi:sugar transferase (PEP-CTERM system associated)
LSTLRVFNHYVRVPFLLLGIIEGCLLFASVIIAILIRKQLPISAVSTVLHRHWIEAIIFAVLMLLAMIASGLYQARLREGSFGFVLRLTTAFLLGTVAQTVVYYILPDIHLWRGILIISIVISFISITSIRYFIQKLDPEVFKKRILILGSGKRASIITELRRRSDRFGFTIIGYVHLRGEQDVVPENKVINLNIPLVDYIEKNDIDEIVLAVEDRRKGIPMHELLDCKMRGVDILDVVTFFERETGKIRLDQVHPSWFLFSEGFHHSAGRVFSKRAFDVLASFFLLSITWPFMLLAAVAIFLESGCRWGTPILFRQVRVGQEGRPFQVLKFRSMIVDAEKSGKAQWATKNDSRITRVGMFIRKTRIDELPQIYNVFRGDMSFVGPRPERPEFVVMLSEKIPYYTERHRVRPGITGWAQLLYPYGSSEQDALEKLQYDLYFVKNHSVFLDILILLQTAEVVLFGRGAR